MLTADIELTLLTRWEAYAYRQAVKHGFLTVPATTQHPRLLRVWYRHCVKTATPHVLVTSQIKNMSSMMFDTTTTGFVQDSTWNEAAYTILRRASSNGACIRSGAVPTSDRLTRTSASRAAKQLLDLFRAQHPQQVAEPVNA